MTIDEIYSKTASHMIEGIRVHEQLANYYDFLNLHGYKRCHEYHYLCESKHFRKLNRYFVNHHEKLIPESKVENPEIIPASWYDYKREDVSSTDIRNAVKTGMEKWVSWERETKILYETMFKEAMTIGEVASAKKICKFIKCVDHELKMAERYMLKLKAIDYDLGFITSEQKWIHNKYKAKL